MTEMAVPQSTIRLKRNPRRGVTLTRLTDYRPLPRFRDGAQSARATMARVNVITLVHPRNPCEGRAICLRGPYFQRPTKSRQNQQNRILAWWLKVLREACAVA
jgi:hypothetical protein